jgi:hypothetical protein
MFLQENFPLEKFSDEKISRKKFYLEKFPQTKSVVIGLVVFGQNWEEFLCGNFPHVYLIPRIGLIA